jgi:hypothetical protein
VDQGLQLAGQRQPPAERGDGDRIGAGQDGTEEEGRGAG